MVCLITFSIVAIKPDSPAFPFLMITAPCLVALFVWSRCSLKSIPLLPLFLIQQGVLYGISLLNFDTGSDRLPPAIISLASLNVGLFFVALLIGWSLGIHAIKVPPPTRWPLLQQNNSSHMKNARMLSIWLLVGSIFFQLLIKSGWLHQLLPDGLWSVFPLLRAFSDAATMLGALIGSLTIRFRSDEFTTWLFWGCVISLFFFSVSNLILATATGLIMALAAGQALKNHRPPWTFALISLLILAFFNQGKIQMRDKYWPSGSTDVEVHIGRMPAFFQDWAVTSIHALPSSSQTRDTAVDSESSQSLLERINNINNLTFVIRAIEEQNISQLNGETYALIPPLLVPRFLWKAKPRAHEGQATLNLHFRRQLTRAETEKTYIAWGLLPEAVGNFGVFFGPLILGIGFGVLLGALEKYAYNKILFSIEGLILIGFLLKLAISYEMVASVFVTTTFQFMVVISLAGGLMRLWMNRRGAAFPPKTHARTPPSTPGQRET